MSKKSIAFFVLSAVLLVAAAIFWLTDNINAAGWSLALFFVAVSFAFRENSLLKGLSFTAIIFSSVTVAMFHPYYFTTWGSFALSSAIIPLIQLLMFGMGSSMSMNDFAAVVKSPKGVIIGVASQFVIMPLLGFALSHTGNFPPEIAAGIILIGCSPSGLASNVMAYLSKANLALSITITSITTLIAPFVTPLLMKLFAGALIEIDVLKMMWDIFKMIIIPIGAGLVFNKLLKGKIQWLDNAMPSISMFAITAIVTIITASGRDNLLKIGLLLIGIALVHNLFGYLLGYWSGRLFKLNEKDCRTIAIEVGMQNAGLASGLAKELGKIATIGLAAAVFGPLMNITGSALASWWHNRIPVDQANNNDTNNHSYKN
ncbi:BASS family bile acid:Na+ symporter [Lacibacter cauensis]|uniref:BASS family bile acid:Na+ symporter n=1 Tax=Lacibacter cauensis TaxID=510947 RepID=A0A562SWB6_9BACT|nr:bile acid:sodium symporter family protein [Lacibacter cauensis]TWI85575.1 BASS family bile acid:Na+ symporter [Lacibacter cauensis]